MPGWPDVSVPGLSTSTSNSDAEAGVFNQNEMCSACPSLTYQQRVIGFGICMICGYILSFMGTMMLFTGGGIPNFAVLYALGNIIALAGSGFLVGPVSHCKKMFHKTRRYAAIVYLSMLAIVLIAGVLSVYAILVLFLLVIQCIAAIWYTASYIPYGRSMLLNTFCGPCKESFKDCFSE